MCVLACALPPTHPPTYVHGTFIYARGTAALTPPHMTWTARPGRLSSSSILYPPTHRPTDPPPHHTTPKTVLTHEEDVDGALDAILDAIKGLIERGELHSSLVDRSTIETVVQQLTKDENDLNQVGWVGGWVGGRPAATAAHPNHPPTLPNRKQ